MRKDKNMATINVLLVDDEDGILGLSEAPSGEARAEHVHAPATAWML